MTIRPLPLGVLPIALSLASLALGCASAPWSEGALGPHCPVELVPSDDIEPGFRISQHMRFTTPEGTIRVDILAEQREGRLEVEGRSALGTRAVKLVQDGRKVRIDDASGRFMGIHPYLILDALHRSLFIEAPGTWAGEQIAETEPSPGRRKRSFFAIEDGDITSLGVQITFEKGDPALGTRPTTRIENRWCGYEALILTR